jgi:prevent-host-death family protein
MNLQEDIRSITDLKIHPAAILSSVRKHRRPTIITQNGRAQVVIQDIASYEATRKALLLLKMLSQSEADVIHGQTVKQSTLFARIDKKLKLSHASKAPI